MRKKHLRIPTEHWIFLYFISLVYKILFNANFYSVLVHSVNKYIILFLTFHNTLKLQWGQMGAANLGSSFSLKVSRWTFRVNLTETAASLLWKVLSNGWWLVVPSQSQYFCSLMIHILFPFLMLFSNVFLIWIANKYLYKSHKSKMNQFSKNIAAHQNAKAEVNLFLN